MFIGSLRLESRESRSEKLRFQRSSMSRPYLDDLPNNLDQLSVQQGLNLNLVQVRNVKNVDMLYDPSVSSSEMLHFAASSGVIVSTQRAALTEKEELSLVQPSERVSVLDSTLANMSDLVLANVNSSPKIGANGDPLCCGDWRSLDSQHIYDWTVNCASGSVVGRESNQKSLFAAEDLSNNSRASNFSASTQCLKPCNYSGYQDAGFQCTLTNPWSEIYDQDVQKQYCKDMQVASHSLHKSTSQDVSYASVEGNQLILLSSCGNQSTGHLQSNRELEAIANDANSQGLCLSLSSNPSSNPDISQFGDGSCESRCQAKAGGVYTNHQNFTPGSLSYMCPIAGPSISSKSYGKSLHDTVGTTSTYVCRHTGPLGPFTGYASILKSSRFLMPAQELLNEFCSVAGSKLMKVFEVSSAKRVSEEVSASVSADAVNAAGTEAGVKDNNGLGISRSTFHSLSEGNIDGRTASSSCESYRPEHHQEKARLLYLQYEVCRRYKQYHQHMQMVASSFESVAGLSTATPYMSVALRTVTRNFRCLKHAISNQLKQVTKALGEDFLSPNTGASSSKCEASKSRLRYIDQGFQNHKFGRANVGFLAPHVLRPQRGLPEHAVAVLRAWLFEHFLHPYPTDADKHMLATQTGLSRNQVSNWFINARVRVWKPMVEEIHMLETKNLAETNQTSVGVDENSADSIGQPNDDRRLNKTATSSTVDKKQLGSSSRRSSMAEQWGQQKKTRVDFQRPTTLDGSLMNVLPYQRSGIDIGGLGAVTLTLGLRHGIENVQQQHQQQQLQLHDNQLRRQFGSQMIDDFAG